MKYTIWMTGVAVLFSRCAQSEESTVQPNFAPPSEKVLAVAQGNNQFATNLYQKLGSTQSGNLFCSPYSIYTAMAMTSAGANGPTQAQMADVMHFPHLEQQFHSSLHLLSKTLVSSADTSNFQLRVANRLWGQQGFHFLPEFLRVTKTDYDADLGLLDFKQSEKARITINTWIDEQTNHKIQNLIARGILDDSTRLVLTNAIFFKARWSHEFSKNLTTNAAFHVSKSLDVEIPTMHQTHEIRYAESDDAQMIDLPYGRLGTHSMLIVLPKTVDGLNGLEQKLSEVKLRKWISELQPTSVAVDLPKFKMTSAFSLKDVLESMGLTLAFSDKADFSKMSSQEQLFISAVIHQAFVDVNEEGTEAAAATAVAMVPTSERIQPKEPVKFRADHPFLFLIRHVSTNSILFVGKLVNPKA